MSRYVFVFRCADAQSRLIGVEGIFFPSGIFDLIDPTYVLPVSYGPDCQTVSVGAGAESKRTTAGV